MTYIPVNTISVLQDRLSESFDLTKPLSSFVGKDAYLVVTQNTFKYALSIGKILTFIPSLNLNNPIGSVFNTVLNQSFVTRFHNPAIPIKTSQGFYSNRLSVFNPVALEDYQVYFTSIDTPQIRDDATRRGFLDDLAIESIHDMSQFLVAINGVFHRTVINNGILYVLDGFRTMRLTGRRDVTVVDTRDIGGHTIVPLTTTNVTQSAWHHPSLVTLQNSIAGKTVFPVIDGYFYQRDHQILEIADSKHLKIKTNKLPLIQQFRHNPRTLYQVDRYGADAPQSSRKYTDAYEAVFLGKSFVPTASLANTNFQYSRLTHYHSFLVIMNNPNLYTLSTDILPTGTPQFYQELSNRSVSGMLNYGCGLCPSYLIWQDPSFRKSIFLPKQDYDVDYQDQSLYPPFIPTLIKDSVKGVNAPAQFFDYVSA